MKKINWKETLSNSKFWFAAVGFVTAVLAIFNIDDLTVEKVAVIITAGGVLAVYILSDSYVEAKNVEAEKIDQIIEEVTRTMAITTDELEKINNKMNEIHTHINENGNMMGG
jgi:hypothetical protein